MATSNPTIFFSHSTDAEFRAWGSAVAAGFAAVGLVQTADTGQINWTTVTKPAGSAASQGYEIYRFNDALQATKPVFLKIEYGSANNNPASLALWLTVGSATNGAGSISTLSTTRTTMVVGPNTSGPSVVATPAWFSGDGSSIGFINSSIVSLGAAFVWAAGIFVERSRNTDGTTNSDGVLVCIVNASTGNASSQQFISFTASTVSAAPQYLPIPNVNRLTSFNTGVDVLIFPAQAFTPKPQGPSLLLLGCGVNDFPRVSTQSVVVSGATRTYLAVTGAVAATAAGGSTVIGLMMRYE